jgi:hypothetical protein
MMENYYNNESGATDRPYMGSEHCLIKMLELKKWCNDYILEYAYIKENGDTVRKGYWYYDCQTVLQVEFQDGTVLDFIHVGGDSKRFKKLKDTDITIEDFFARYIANGYEIETEPELPIELEDIVL